MKFVLVHPLLQDFPGLWLRSRGGQRVLFIFFFWTGCLNCKSRLCLVLSRVFWEKHVGRGWGGWECHRKKDVLVPTSTLPFTCCVSLSQVSFPDPINYDPWMLTCSGSSQDFFFGREIQVGTFLSGRREDQGSQFKSNSSFSEILSLQRSKGEREDCSLTEEWGLDQILLFNAHQAIFPQPINEHPWQDFFSPLPPPHMLLSI